MKTPYVCQLNNEWSLAQSEHFIYLSYKRVLYKLFCVIDSVKQVHK